MSQLGIIAAGWCAIGGSSRRDHRQERARALMQLETEAQFQQRWIFNIALGRLLLTVQIYYDHQILG